MSGLKKGAITLTGAVAATCAFMGPATSIYFNTGMGVQSAGNAFGFAFLVAMIAMLFVAYVIAQFAKKLPSSGFAYTFSVNGLGSKAGFLTGWLLVGGYAMLSPMLLSAISYFLSLFFKTYFHLNISWGIFAIIIAATILYLSCSGVSESIRVALVMLIIEIVVMVIFFATILMHGGAEGITFATFNPSNTLKPGDWNGIGTAVLWSILMFVGFESAATLGEETKDATKNIPKALFYSVIGIGLFFLLGAFSAVVGYGPSHVSEVVASIVKGTNPWDPLFTTFWGKGASAIVMLVILNSIFVNLLSGFNAVARILYAMGRENVFPKALGQVSKSRQVPVNASILYMTVSIILTLVLGYTWDPMTVYGWTGTILGLVLIIIYVIINVSLFAFYRKIGEFHWFKHGVMPLVATILLYMPMKGVIMSTLPAGGGKAPMTYIPYVIVGWFLLGILYTIFLSTKRKQVFENMGSVFE
jgi:amino acid transporter